MICTKCKRDLNINCFSLDSKSKKGIKTYCKDCASFLYKIWHLENKNRKSEYWKKYYIENIEDLSKNSKKYKSLNKNKVKINYKKWYNKNALKAKGYFLKNKNLYEKYYEKLTIEEDARFDDDGYLLVRCAHCREYFYPTRRSLYSRISCLLGKESGEGRLYCSNSCKQNCSVYGYKSYGKDLMEFIDNKEKPKNVYKDKRNSTVQRQWREMVLERDGHKCIKCGATENLIAHHIEGIRWISMEAADIDMGVTLCKKCDKIAHKKEGCRYTDMQCK